MEIVSDHKPRNVTRNLAATRPYGRTDWVRTLTAVAARAAAAQKVYAVLWLDIDRFKRVNASFGHQAGDQVLAELGQRIDSISQGRGRSARIGDDEFVLIFADCNPEQAELIAQDLLAGMSRPLEIGNLRIRPSVSIGVAGSRAYLTPSAIIEQAEQAMHLAKRMGGAQFRFADDDFFNQPALRDDMAIEEALHSALELGTLHLEYQPIIRVADGALESLEALMRCQMNDAPLPPARFIPVAERTGLIVRLGDWSLMTAACLVARLHARGTRTRLSVNVSRAQLTAPKFSQTLNAALLLSDVASELIELEITESLFMDDSDIVRRNLRAALDAGFQLAIDDFGTGYSCLACLKDLPAQKLKLDRAFIIDLPENPRSHAVAKAVVHMALDLGMSVVAEGVETAAQYATLCSLGVTAIQGYFVARPMPEAHLDAWLRTRSQP